VLSRVEPMTSAPRTEENILEGRLEDFPLPDIIQVLQVSAKSGTLLLRRDDGQTAVISFRGGAVIQVVSTEGYQSLGDRLVGSGAITRVDLQLALDYMARSPGMRVGDALVELGNVTRPRIEAEVKSQMAETIERLLGWVDAQFEFRVGLLSLARESPELAVDLVHERGVEPRHLLLEATLLQDRRKRLEEAHAEGIGEATLRSRLAEELRDVEARSAPADDLEDEAEKIIRWFDEGASPAPADWQDPLGARTAASFLSISEELFVASGRGEVALLLLRYASELYADGGLVVRTGEGFRVLGQFGEAFAWGGAEPRQPRTHFAPGECPLFDSIVAERRPYVGLVVRTPGGGLARARSRTDESRPALAIPLFMLGNVSLILFCRSAIPGAADARALIALVRQVSVTLENAALRELSERAAADAAAGKGPAGPGPVRVRFPQPRLA